MPDLRLTVPFSFNKADIKKKEFINAVGRLTSRMFSLSPSSKFAGV